MKKIYLSIALAAFSVSMSGQTVNIHFKNGQSIVFPSDNVEYVDFSEKAPDPTVSAGQVVDLGLSVYWASCNLGAEKPEETGDYYAWGETTPKSIYTKSNYSYYDNNTNQYIDIGNNISGTEYDAATVNLGSDWRMPTGKDLSELINNCTWEWTQLKGVNGYRITGKNGNSIFISGKSWLYWLGELSSGGDGFARTFKISSDTSIGTTTTWRYEGRPIRPVTTNLNAGGDPIDHSQDFLVTDKISASYTGGSTYIVNGVIRSGSVLNFKISNGSTESIELTSIQLINGSTGSEGNNALSGNVTIVAGESKDYSITVGSSGISKPQARFTYRYNKKKYYVEASVPDM